MGENNTALSPFESVEALEQDLGLPKGFYTALMQEDDWSFVIKLNALFEAAATHILSARLNLPEIEEELTQLDFADKRYGKVRLLRKLGCIEAHQATILNELATLRNSLVHNITNVKFSFKEWSKGWDSNQAKKYVAAFGNGVADPFSVNGVEIPASKFTRQNVKLAMWLTCAELLGCLYLDKSLSETRRISEVLMEVAKIMDKSGEKITVNMDLLDSISPWPPQNLSDNTK